ncbi:MAG: SPOR domain-containing protein [Pseudomonadota bacterium]
MGIGNFFFSFVARIVKITLGVAFTIGVFFGAVYVVDYYAAKNAQAPSNPKFLPYAGRLKSADANKGNGQGSSEYSHTFFDILKGKKNDHAEPFSTTESVTAQNGKPKGPGISENHAAKTGETRPREPAPDEKKAGTASEPPAYTIQLGSFQNGEVAKAFSDSLAAKGYEPHIMKLEVPGKGNVYRVRIGRYKNMEEAQKKAAELEKKENISAFITSK